MKFLRSKLSYIILAFVLIAACSSEVRRELSLSPQILSLSPANPVSFASELGDTIEMFLKSSSQEQVELFSSQRVGALDEYDIILAEQREFQLANDSFAYFFNYRFSTELIQSSDAFRDQKDRLEIQFSDVQDSKSEVLSFDFRADFLEIDPNLVVYRDSLNLASITFYEVFSPTNGTDVRQFYFTIEQGIVAFVDRDNVIYERID